MYAGTDDTMRRKGNGEHYTVRTLFALFLAFHHPFMWGEREG